jgi:chromosome segregation protein
LRGLEQIKESLDGYGAGVKAILQESKQNGGNGVRGVVADAVSAPARYERALGAALGERLQYVIVEDAARGLEAVRHLKARKAGRSSFAPVNLREARETGFPGATEEVDHGPLLDLVEVAPEYACLAKCLLGDVFVVETLEHALELWQENGTRNTLVTLDGEAVSPEGVISGGVGQGDEAGLLRKNREIRELREEVARKAEAMVVLETALSQSGGEVEDLEGRLESAREDVHRKELQVVHISKDLAQLRERRERLEERHDALEFENEDLGSGLDALRCEAVSLETEKARLLKIQEGAEQRVHSLQEQLDQARETLRTLHDELTRHQVAEASDSERREGLVERIRGLETSLENAASGRERLIAEARESLQTRDLRVEELQRINREAETLRAELVREEGALAELAESLDDRRGELTEDEKAAAQARRETEAGQRLVNEAELGIRELELRVENLRERFRERLAGDIEAEAESGVPDEFDPQRAETRIQALDAKLSGFGEINLLAIDEYEDRKQRFEFLTTQKRDLEESLASLKQAIARINRVSRERFAETFEKVSETFHELYPKLFHGGEARLLLTEPDNLLETGIDIVARPPGKRPQHISLLSGGEKALTAVGLIFSIFLVKPSPFCILDEVDAPLDDANIGRFSEMVRGMAISSQFLIVTHNKSTMEAADHLYGVTMSDPGVSKTVSVRLTEERPAAAA